MNEQDKVKEVVKTVAGLLAILGVCAIIGAINPMLLSTDGFLELMDNVY